MWESMTKIKYILDPYNTGCMLKIFSTKTEFYKHKAEWGKKTKDWKYWVLNGSMYINLKKKGKTSCER